LPAKPIIDILLVVTDSAKEAEYVSALEGAGYKLRVREPGWYEHRMFKGQQNNVNLHVFSVGCPEVGRMLAFREWLRTNEADRELYARSKRTLAQQEWKSPKTTPTRRLRLSKRLCRGFAPTGTFWASDAPSGQSVACLGGVQLATIRSGRTIF